MMKKHGITWRTVHSYAPASNERAERRVGTIKRAVMELVQNDGNQWKQAVLHMLYEYRLKSIGDRLSPF